MNKSVLWLGQWFFWLQGWGFFDKGFYVFSICFFGKLSCWLELTLVSCRQSLAYGAVKSPEAPSAIVEEITRRYLEEKGARVVVTRTQNDRVVEIVANLCHEVVALDRLAQQTELDLLARMDVLPKDKEFDPVTLVIRKSYGTRLIQSGPRRRSSVVKVVALTDLLDYEEGDAVVLVGYR